jgi:hypothetical protein
MHNNKGSPKTNFVDREERETGENEGNIHLEESYDDKSL